MARIAKVLVIVLMTVIVAWNSASLAAEKDQLAFVRGGNIWIARTDGREARQLTFSQKDQGPALSPDGRWVAYYSGAGEETGFGQVFMIPTQGGMVQQFRHAGIQGAEYPAFSPDGKSLLFVGLSNLKVKKVKGVSDQSYATMSLALADLASGAVRRVVSHPNTLLDVGYIYSHPAFSPDGRLIAYQESGSDVSGGFVVIDLKGQRRLRFPHNPRDAAPYWRPQFSADGREMLCYSPATTPGQKDVVYLVNLATLQKTRVTEGSSPCFVDQGRAIVFERWPGNRWTAQGPVQSDLWRLELTPGAQPRKLIADGGQPAGQP